MPSATAISLNDGQATPVAHSFVPAYVGSDKQVFEDRDVALTSAGRARLISSFSSANGSRKTNRISIRFDLPTEQTIDTVTSVAYTARFSCDIVIPEQATQAERDDLAAYIANALSATDIAGMIADLDPIY